MIEKLDVFVNVSEYDPSALPEGIYHISLSEKGKEYRAEKRGGKWFFADGTGWMELIPKEQVFKAIRFYYNLKTQG